MSSDTAELLNDIHKHMVHISLLTQQISVHSSSAKVFLTSEEDYCNVVHSVSETFKGVTIIMNKALEHSKEIEKRVETFIAMASEFVECCVAKWSLSQLEKVKSKEAYDMYIARIHKLDQEKQELVQDMVAYERFAWLPFKLFLVC